MFRWKASCSVSILNILYVPRNWNSIDNYRSLYRSIRKNDAFPRKCAFSSPQCPWLLLEEMSLVENGTVQLPGCSWKHFSFLEILKLSKTIHINCIVNGMFGKI